MRKIAFQVVFVVLMISSCSEERVHDEDVVVNDVEAVQPSIDEGGLEHELNTQEIGFADFYYKFSATVESKNYQIFNGFIHPNHGFYAIESPGAMPVFSSVYDVGEFISKKEGKRFFDLPFAEIDQVVAFEELPKVICEDQVFDKLGCFAFGSNEFKTSKIWDFAGLNEAEVLEVASLVDSVDITVVNTYNYIFHFSLIEGNWYLTFMDLRAPCAG